MNIFVLGPYFQMILKLAIENRFPPKRSIQTDVHPVSAQGYTLS